MAIHAASKPFFQTTITAARRASSISNAFGGTWIDAKYFQPVYVFTKLSHRLPFAVRPFLVALPGLGFNVQYKRQAGDVWFPTSEYQRGRRK
ncbi:MAG TPA: hypothetical protein VF283_16265 [Bryobacteraceae bacterium]